MAQGDVVLQSVLDGLTNSDVYAVLSGNAVLPDILILDPLFGVLGIDVDFASDAQGNPDQLKQKHSKKRLQLRSELNDLSEALKVRVTTVFIDRELKEGEESGSKRYARALDLSKLRLDQALSESEVSALNAAKALFAPHFQFQARIHAVSEDSPEFQKKREIKRFNLDKSQRDIAIRKSSGVTILKGPAGSGKTLVLAARAKFLATENASWEIQIICYNNALKPYLQTLVANFRNITVSTFYEFTSSRGHRLTMKDATATSALYEFNLIKNGGRFAPTVDAMMIDEGQDFWPAWLDYLIACVRPNRGGAMIAGDENQSIYRTSDTHLGLAKSRPEVCHLSLPYRSTDSILAFVNCLIPEAKIDNVSEAPPGPLPHLVFVLGGVRYGGQAKALVSDILDAKRKNASLTWNDFAILCTRHDEQLRPLAGQLQRILQQEFGSSSMLQVIFKKGASKLDLRHDSIKLMTAHSAKGLEFSNVFLVGLESLAKDYSELPSNFDSDSDLTEAKLNLVAPTRAKDFLTVYYSKENAFLGRLIGRQDLYSFRKYPEDYEVNAKWPS